MNLTRAVAALSLLAVVGCGSSAEGGFLESSELVCDEFAAHARDGLQAAERPEVVRSMGEVIGNAVQPLQDAHEALERTATGTDGAYRIAADTFAAACIDNGWES